MGEFVVCIDQSSAGTKAFVYGSDGSIASSAGISHEQRYPRPGWVEVDPLLVLANAKTAVARALNGADIVPARVAALGLTNQRETIVAWDAVTGGSALQRLGMAG